MKQRLKVIEVTSSVSALLSKLLLAFDSIVGWPFSLLGYILVAIYNYLRKDNLLATTVVGLAALSAYGWYKWSAELKGLLPVDYAIIGVTIIFCLTIYITSARRTGFMGHIQGLITVLTISAFLMLGYKLLIGGWFALLLSHAMLAFFYHKRGARYYVALQIISMIIAGSKLLKLII